MKTFNFLISFHAAVAMLMIGGYSNGDYINQNRGYYESYNENEVTKVPENILGRSHVDTSGLNPCLQSVITKLTGGHNGWGKTLANFYNGRLGYVDFPDFTVQFRTKIFASTDTVGATTSQNGYTSYTIYTNPEVLDSCSELFAAKTLIHEFTHVILQQFLNSHNLGDTIAKKDYDSRFLLYTRWIHDNRDAKSNPAYSHHEYMAGQLIDAMADALKEFDGGKHDDEYYWIFTWGGLQDTQVFKYYQQHPMTSESQRNQSALPAFPRWTWRYALTADRMSKVSTLYHAEMNNNNGSVSPLFNQAGCY